MISLVGGRGSGKSTVGRLLADRLGWPFADSDSLCVEAAGRSVADIFASDGESAFRRLEEDVLAGLLGDGVDRVVATGGGAVLSPATRRRLVAAGPVVWLTAAAETLAERVAADSAAANVRPSLTGNDPAAEMAEVLASRRPLYQQVATITEPVEDRTPSEIAESIAARCLAGGDA